MFAQLQGSGDSAEDQVTSLLLQLGGLQADGDLELSQKSLTSKKKEQRQATKKKASPASIKAPTDKAKLKLVQLNNEKPAKKAPA